MMETLSGIKLINSFDLQLIADFDEIWNSTFHHKWQPVYKKDLRLQQNYDFFRTIVNRVKQYNEPYDMVIVGDRGLGKSAFGLGAAQLIHRYFYGENAKFPLENVCFDVDSWIALTDDLAGSGGRVVILDEVGTEGSLSSRTSMSKGNRTTSDIISCVIG